LTALSNLALVGGLTAAFFVFFETCLAWLCAALTRISNATMLRALKLFLFEVLIPVPVAAIIGYAVGCTVGGRFGVQVGLLSGAGFLLYLFLAIARSVYETSYARAALFSLVFTAANLAVALTLSCSPSVNSLHEAIISWPK
jgi:hypothetical protein